MQLSTCLYAFRTADVYSFSHVKSVWVCVTELMHVVDSLGVVFLLGAVF